MTVAVCCGLHESVNGLVVIEGKPRLHSPADRSLEAVGHADRLLRAQFVFLGREAKLTREPDLFCMFRKALGYRFIGTVLGTNK